MNKLPFTVPLTVSGITIAEIEGVAEIHFDRVGEPEIFIMDIDGRDASNDLTQRRLASDHPLYQTVKKAIWSAYEDKLYDMADEVERGRISYAQEMAAE